MRKGGSSIHKLVTSPQITVLKRFLALKLNSAFQHGQSTTPPGSRLLAPRSTLPGKRKSILNVSTVGQMLRVALGLRRSCGVVLSPFSLQPMAKTSLCSLFTNNLLSTRCSPWYNTNKFRKNPPHQGGSIDDLVLPGSASRSFFR